MMKNQWTLQAHNASNTSYLALKWVCPEVDDQGLPAERLPEAVKASWPVKHGFFAAGKQYRSLQQLTATEIGKYHYRDIYGRDVIALRELFPCFDSYDYLHENRYYRWFFLRDDQKLTMVYYADTRDTLEVTEDVAQLRPWQWEHIREIWNLE